MNDGMEAGMCRWCGDAPGQPRLDGVDEAVLCTDCWTDIAGLAGERGWGLPEAVARAFSHDV